MKGGAKATGAAKATGMPYWQGFLASSLAPAVSVFFTNPLEVAKVRQQMQGELGTAGGRLRGGSFGALQAIYKIEGLGGIQAGLKIAMLREASKNLFRIGAFEPILDAVHDAKRGPAPVYKKMLAGALSGALGSYICNPIEIVKTRLQAQAGAPAAGRDVVGATVGPAASGCRTFGYKGTGDAIYRICTEEGVRGCWKGCHVSAMRSAVNTSTNLTAYTTLRDEAKRLRLLPDGILLHVVCGTLASFASVCAGNPLDVVRTRVYNQPVDAITKQGLLYKNALHAVTRIVASEGPAALYKGFWAHYLRVGPHYALTFVLLEQIKGYLAARETGVVEGKEGQALKAL